MDMICQAAFRRKRNRPLEGATPDHQQSWWLSRWPWFDFATWILPFHFLRAWYHAAPIRFEVMCLLMFLLAAVLAEIPASASPFWTGRGKITGQQGFQRQTIFRPPVAEILFHKVEQSEKEGGAWGGSMIYEMIQFAAGSCSDTSSPEAWLLGSGSYPSGFPSRSVLW